MAARLTERLQHLVDIGLGYLSLSRETATLSGGESQRVKMVRHLGNSLTEMLYILDEPSVGLHPRDVHRLNDLLQEAARQGQHRAGGRARPRRDRRSRTTSWTSARRRGRTAARSSSRGAIEALKSADTLTGQFLKQHLPIKRDGAAANRAADRSRTPRCTT